MDEGMVPESLKVRGLTLLGLLSALADDENAAAKGDRDEDNAGQDG